MISDHACHNVSRHREEPFADSRFRTFQPFRPSRLRLLRKQGQGQGLDKQWQVLRLKVDELRSKEKSFACTRLIPKSISFSLSPLLLTSLLALLMWLSTTKKSTTTADQQDFKIRLC